MMKSKVAIIKCNEYEPDKVYKAILKGINLLGGIKEFVNEKETVLIKPNLLTNDDLASTHPAVFESVIKIIKQVNSKIFYGDTPGYGYPLEKTKKSKLKPIADKYNVKFGDFEKGRAVKIKDHNNEEQLMIVNAAMDADCIFSLSRMKTHMGTKITGALKNQYGCILGKHKLRYHYKYSKTKEFSKLLVKINKIIKPRLFILDGIIAMEGNGPANGDPVKMNVIILSNDPIAADAAFCKLINYNPNFLPFLKYGELSGLGKYKDDDVLYLGDPIDGLINYDFNINREKLKDTKEHFLLTWFGGFIYSRPVIKEEKCTLCKRCVRVCPVPMEGISIRKNISVPVFNYKYCVKCYCCQEMCPEDAIYVKPSFINRLNYNFFKRSN